MSLEIISKQLTAIKYPGERIMSDSVGQINDFATVIPTFNADLDKGRAKLLEVSRAYVSPTDQELVSRVLVTDLGIGLKI